LYLFVVEVKIFLLVNNSEIDPLKIELKVIVNFTA
jgi:hypothetical protein